MAEVLDRLARFNRQNRDHDRDDWRYGKGPNRDRGGVYPGRRGGY
jgi:hypothetical protein